MRGRRRARMLVGRALNELVIARSDAGLSIAAVARACGMSKSALARLLSGELDDLGALTRRTRGPERDGQVDAILIVLADTANNRRIAPELRAALGTDYASEPRALLKALRSGERLVGSGVVLV